MKKVIFIIFTLLWVIQSKSQDTITAKENLTDVQVIGIRTDKRNTSTTTIIRTKDYINIDQKRDPFYLISQVSPSVYAQSDNGAGTGYSYLRMRGFDQTRINFNLNGIPLNEMEDQGLYFSNMPGFYNYISRISIERGVGTSKYGNTSIGGSVNMEPIDMTNKSFYFSSQLMSDASFVNGDNGNIDAIYSSGLNKSGVSFQLGGSYSNSLGFKDHSNSEGGSIFYGFGFFKKNNILKIYGFNGVSSNNLAFNGSIMDSLNINYKFNSNLKTDIDTFHQNFLTINWINQSFKNLKFNTSIYYNNVNGNYNTGNILFGVNSNQYEFLSNMVYSNGNNILNIGINSNIYNRFHFGSDSSAYYPFSINNISPYSNRGYKNDIIGYTKYTRIFGKINIFGDIQWRIVNFEAKSHEFMTDTYRWSFINPKIGIKLLGDKNDYFISISNTKREPTRTDMIQNMVQVDSLYGANTDNINIIKGFKMNLSPENAYDIEIGNNYHYNGLLLNFNLYAILVKNEFVATGEIDPYSGFMKKISVESSFRTGIEGDGRYNSKTLSMFWNFQYQFSKINNEEVPFSPKVTINYGVSKSICKFTIGLVEQYISSMSMGLGKNKKSNGYLVINSFINYNFTKNVFLSLKINNILNKKYYIPAGILNDNPTYYVGQLNNWNLTVKYKI